MLYTAFTMKIKKYTIQKTIGGMAYATGVLAWKYFSWRYADSPYKYWLILLPVFPLIYSTIIFHRQLAEKDELWRKIVTESLAFTATATTWTCVSYVFVRQMGGPEFRAEWVFCIACVYYSIGYYFSWRRYK